MTSLPNRVLFATSAVLCAVALADPTLSPSRGELLYSTHCIACHSAQVHWRDKKQATDWDSLEKQVRRWQAAGMLQWNDDDIHEVTRHLNDTYYHFHPGRRALNSGVPSTALATPHEPPRR